MKNSRKIVLTAAVAGLFLAATISFVGTSWANQYKGEQYASQAKITLKAAEGSALKVVPGKITDEELEKEGGGSGLRYSFDISYNGKTHEVGIDAVSGKVLENSISGPNAD